MLYSSNNSNAEVLVAASDFHFPFHCKIAVQKFLKLIKDMKPQYIALLGDVVDFYSLSRFRKDPQKLFLIKKEIEAVRSFLEQVRSSCEDGRILYFQGNHEERMYKFICDHAPQIFPLSEEFLRPETILDLDRLKIEYINRDTGLKIGPFQLLHGNLIRKDPGKTALEIIQRCRKNVIVGHSHRLAQIHLTIDDTTYTGIECGCMTDPRFHDYLYYPYPNWTKGCVVVHFRNQNILNTSLVRF